MDCFAYVFAVSFVSGVYGYGYAGAKQFRSAGCDEQMVSVF